jgi:hypothetical protein
MTDMNFVCTVLMDGRDVTSWVKNVKVSQEDSINRKFTITFSSWDQFDDTNRFDIYGSYNPANPFAETLIRNGIIPVDQYRTVRLGPDSVPYVVGEGYDYVWQIRRKSPKKTIIMIPGRKTTDDNVQQAIENFGKPIGRYQVWTYVTSLKGAITRLAHAGGVRVSVQIPNYPMAPFVVDPAYSYWDAIEELASPYAPHIYYVRSTNTLVIADRSSEIMGASNLLTLSAKIVSDLEATPVLYKRVRRVIVRIPPWR